MTHIKEEFIFVSDVFGELVLDATSWNDALNEVLDGYANTGNHKIIKRTYRWISDEPQMVDTTRQSKR